MANPFFHANPHFAANVELLVRLHDLIREGKGDTEEADVLRDQMDVHWQHLNAHEEEAIRGLSTDLYSIGQGDSETPSGASAGAISAEFVDFAQRGEWHQALRLVREHRESYARADLAWIRGVCWAHLRYPAAAIRFFEERARLQPLKPDEEVWLLTSMMQAKRSADALPRAEQIARRELDPLLLLKAAEVFSTRASELNGDQAHALRRAAIDAAQRGLQLAKTRTGDKLLAVLLVGANLLLAFDHEALGEIGEALQCCDEALRLDPTNASAMMLRAWLNRDRNPAAAAGDFRRGLSSGLTATFTEMPLMPPAPLAGTF